MSLFTVPKKEKSLSRIDTEEKGHPYLGGDAGTQ